MNWYLEVFRKYATFAGRARRTEYWVFVLVNSLIGIALGVTDGVFNGAANTNVTALGSLYSLIVLIPSLAVGVRRLHDTGRSGWWMLLAPIPLVNLVLLIFYIQEGVAGPNEYGPDPKVAGAAPAAYPAAPAGWLPDPTGRHQLRYWDAVRWTEHVSDNGVAAVDPARA